MVILHITSTRAGVVGGVPAAVPPTAQAQSRFAHTLLINTQQRGGDTPALDGGFALSRLPAPFSQPDLVVFHEVYKFEYIGISRALREAGVPYIVVPHGCLSRRAQRKKFAKKLAANLLFFHRFLRGARAIQYLSAHERALSAFPRYPSFIASGGITMPDALAVGGPSGQIKLVYIGRLDLHIKGLDLLLRAVGRCREALASQNAKIEIYGPDEGGAHARLAKMAERQGIQSLVHIGCGKFGREKEEILLGADAFIQCSRTEGLPLGPLQALSYGLPCLLTAGVGLGELVLAAGAGYTAETSVRGIAQMLSRFLAEYHEKGPVMRAAARALAENRFDEDKAAEGAVAEYARVLGDQK